MWVLWLLFFVQFAAVGVYFTYLNIYYRLAGLTGTQIGVISMATGLIGVVCVIGWGYLSDRTHKNRLLIAFGALGGLLIAQFIPLVHTFAAFLFLGCLGAVMTNAPMTLVDSTTLALLGERRNDYGRFRLGGSIGYIIAALTAGFVFDRISLRWMFPAYGAIMLCFVVVALLLPEAPHVNKERQKTRVMDLVRQPVWVVFTGVILLFWIAYNAAMSFLGVAMQSMHASQSLVGMAVTIGAIIEAPLMMYSGKLLGRFGAVKLFLASLILSTIRYFLLAWMPRPEWAILINVINGPGFVFFWTSAVTYINRLATPALAGTAQGLFNSTMGLAGMVSGLLAGWLFDQLGPQGMFMVMGFCCLAGLILFSLGNLTIRRKAGLAQVPEGSDETAKAAG